MKGLAKARGRSGPRLLKGAGVHRASLPQADPNPQDLYRSLVDGLPEMILRKDIAGRYVFANQRLCHWLNLPADAIVGKTDRDLFAPELAQRILVDDQRAALLLVVLEGLSYREVAEVQGVPIGTVMSRLARARAQIKSYLDGGRPPLRRVK